MNFIGLSEMETKVMVRLSKGDSHETISKKFNIDLDKVFYYERKALDKLQLKNKITNTERKIREILKITFVITLCILPQKRARNNTRGRRPHEYIRISRSSRREIEV